MSALGKGVAETRGYNIRTGLNSISSTPYNLGLTYAGSGDVLTANDSVNGKWIYHCDGVNGLINAVTSAGPARNLTYQYDAYRNAPCVTGGQTEGACTSLSFVAATNHITDDRRI